MNVDCGKKKLCFMKSDAAEKIALFWKTNTGVTICLFGCDVGVVRERRKEEKTNTKQQQPNQQQPTRPA